MYFFSNIKMHKNLKFTVLEYDLTFHLRRMKYEHVSKTPFII